MSSASSGDVESMSGMIAFAETMKNEQVSRTRTLLWVLGISGACVGLGALVWLLN